MVLYGSPDYQTSLSLLAFQFNIDFQDGGHFGFQIRTILATFDLQVTSILPMKFESIALLVQEKKLKIDFQHGWQGNHLGFPIRMILAIFELQITLILPIKMDLSILEEFKIDFHDGNCGGDLVFPFGAI